MTYTPKKVSEFPAATELGDADLLFVEQSGVAKRLAGALLAAFCQAAIKALVESASDSATNAEKARQAIEGMLVAVSTLAPGASATVEKSIVDGVVKLAFGLPAGQKGDPGNSIQSIVRTAGTGAAGTTDTYTVTLTDGSKTTFQVYNGKDGTGAGDMTKSVYDPQGKAQDIFAYAQEKLKGAVGQIVGFDKDGNAAAQDAPEIPTKTSDLTNDSGFAVKPKYVPVTLAASGWGDDLAQTVSAAGVLADETKQLILPVPAAASRAAYDESGIRCTAQAAGSLTFTAKTVPTADLTVYVVLQEVTAT